MPSENSTLPAAMDRRTFLKRSGIAGAGAVALTGVVRSPADAQVDPSLAPFVHGVASGDPLADRVILWTRVTPEGAAASGGPVEVSWRIATDPAMTAIVGSGVVTTDAARDHTVKVDATGLRPATFYFYAFTSSGRSSLVGRTKTAPAGTTDLLRFGMVSCSNYQHGYFHAYSHLADRDDLDAILHLGDYVYEYGLVADGGYGSDEAELDSPRPHDPPHEMVTLQDYRTRYALYHLDPDLRRLHQKFPFVNTWDDHEITNDSYRDGAQNHQPDEGDYQVRKRIAWQVFNEWLPIRTPDPAAPPRIWRNLPYGDLCEIIVMDTRIEGRDEEAGGVLQYDPTAPFQSGINDPDRRMISPEQQAFVEGRLAGSSAQWKVLAQQVMMMQWKAGALPTQVGGQDAPSVVVTPGGTPVNGDAWDGYPAERGRLLGFIRDNDIPGVVVLTGDIHSSWAADVAIDPYDPTVYDPITQDGAQAVEFVCPSVTSASFYQTLGYGYRDGSIAIEEATKLDNPHIRFVEGDTHGYVVLELTPERIVAEFFGAHPTQTRAHTHERFGAYESAAGSNAVTALSAEPTVTEPAPAPPTEPPAPAPEAEPEAPAAPLPTTGGGAVIGAAAAIGVAGLLTLAERRAAQQHG